MNKIISYSYHIRYSSWTIKEPGNFNFKLFMFVENKHADHWQSTALVLKVVNIHYKLIHTHHKYIK